MAEQERKTVKLSAKLGDRSGVIKAQATAETNYGFVDPPAGIRDGVAELQKCYFSEIQTGVNKGKVFFRAQAGIVDPITFPTPRGVVRTKGLATSIMISIVETTTKTGPNTGAVTTEDDQIAKIMEEMRKLGGEDFTADVEDIDDLPALAKVLEEMDPPIRFLFTIQESRDPKYKPTHYWNGTKNLPLDYEPPVEEGEAGGMVEDVVDAQSTTVENTSRTPNTPKGKDIAAEQKAVQKVLAAADKGKGLTKAPPVKAPEPEPDPEPDPVDDTPAEMTLAELAADADDGDSPTQADSAAALIARAVELGIPEKKAKNTKTWDALVEMIEHLFEAQSGETADVPDEVADEDEVPEPEPEPDVPTGPSVGDEVMFTPKDAKGKPAKPVKAVISVLHDDETADIKVGKAAYKSIALARLHPVD